MLKALCTTAFVAAATMTPACAQVAASSLVGSYAVTGTNPGGETYDRSGTVDITLAPSGALELEWDSGQQVGVGQMAGNVLAATRWAPNRTTILVMKVNPDGSLSAKW